MGKCFKFQNSIVIMRKYSSRPSISRIFPDEFSSSEYTFGARIFAPFNSCLLLVDKKDDFLEILAVKSDPLRLDVHAFSSQLITD